MIIKIKNSPILILIFLLTLTLNPITASTSQFQQPVPFYCNPPFATHSFPPTPIHQNLRTPPPARQILVKTAYNFSMYVDTYDATVSRTIANTGTWEPDFIGLLGKLVKQGDVVLNVGAQTGLEAIVMGKLVGDMGRLFIVEPYSFSYQLVSKNVEQNGLGKITSVYRKGASDQQNIGLLRVKMGNTGASQIFPLQTPTSISSPNPNTNLKGFFLDYQQQVHLSPLDSILSQSTILNFALIDVQGMQVKVLRGMFQLIDRSPQLIIMVEWQYGKNQGGDRKGTEELLEFLVGKGYRVYSYSHKDTKGSCQMGKWKEFRKIETLFHIKMLDLFFFPKDYPLPQ